jgi:hypothetical protein
LDKQEALSTAQAVKDVFGVALPDVKFYDVTPPVPRGDISKSGLRKSLSESASFFVGVRRRSDVGFYFADEPCR